MFPLILIKTTTLRINLNIDGGMVTSYIFTVTHFPLTLSNLSSPILFPLLTSKLGLPSPTPPSPDVEDF
jgi:hypothetical protein